MKNYILHIGLLAFVTLGTLPINKVNAQSPQIFYVKKGSHYTGDGTSWALAFPDLQQAIAAATASSGLKEIWVANGEYRPTQGSNRSISFQLPAFTNLYGGFVGNETNKQARNSKLNRTVLSGDIGLLFDKSDNSYHVITAKNVDQNSGIDGFIVTQGNANGLANQSHDNSGGGILILSNTGVTGPQITNCEFVNNGAAFYGGGVANISDGGDINTQIANCFVNGNIALFGGGIANVKITGSNLPKVINCSFSTNKATEKGGAIANIESGATIVNNTFSKNSSIVNGGAILNSGISSPSIQNSILWKNYKSTNETASNYNQIYDDQSTPVVRNNTIQGGYGIISDNNQNKDPMFKREPSIVGKFPRTSVIPIAYTDPKYENELSFSGSKFFGSRSVYLSYLDHPYNKLYIVGNGIQVIDFANLTDGIPTSSLYSGLYWGRIQNDPAVAIHTGTNKLYFGSYYSGIVSIDRATNVVTPLNVLEGEPVNFPNHIAEDVVVDDVNNLLYSPIYTANTGEKVLYGLLELNLSTNTKRWINTTSSPVSIPQVFGGSEDSYWNGHRLYLDKAANVLYYSSGMGVWWWNRTNNQTGLYNTAGGMPLVAGNPKLPSNLTTGMFIDPADNKFYIGTHAGLFVWDRNNNTSKVYNTSNSVLTHNLINIITKNDSENLIYASCEVGGVFSLNTVTGEQKLYTKDNGNEVNPQLIHTRTEAVYFDRIDRKLYVSSDGSNGGVWVKDYNNLVPDFGDLTLGNNSPAIDKADPVAYPINIASDLNGSTRFVDFPTISAENSLDQGAYELGFTCTPSTISFTSDKSDRTISFTPNLSQGSENCTISYNWNFGDGTSSNLSSPSHLYKSVGTFQVALQVTYKCGICPSSTVTAQNSVTIDPLCESIHCNGANGVSIGVISGASGYKLSIGGKIITEGLNVSSFGQWPDYVFSKGYKILPLPELQRYVRDHGHLPGMPSALEVSKDGIQVENISRLMLEKVEELTLHLINLNDRLDALKKEKR